ncbi:MAG TPA: hypothetical protein PLJ21_05025, partial [Pseudobdellovibrionaceae bacterium]|nr:hypothetical protein [Pseudobdellovibrionaceae bacterium]
GRCDVLGEFEMSERCPLQAIIRFRPLCGGTVAIPTLSGLPCTGPVTGIEIIAGVAILMNGQFVYHQKTDQDRDSILMRVSSNLFNY